MVRPPLDRSRSLLIDEWSMTGLLGRPNLVRVKLADPLGVDARLAPDRDRKSVV